jgi:HEAT repeat protein
LPFLLDALKAPEPDHRVRRALYTALGHLGDPVGLPNLYGCLEEEAREELRGACVQAIAAIGDPGSLPGLLTAYREDGHKLVRARLVEAFGRYPQESSVELLIGLTAGGTDAALRQRAIRSLGETGSTAAVDPLLAVLAAAGGEEQGVVVEALGRLGHRAASEPLAELLEKTEYPVLRSRIVIALAAIRDGDAYPALVASLSDEVSTVRFYAVRALTDLGKAAAAPHLTDFYQDIAPSVEDFADSNKKLAVLIALQLQAEALVALVDLDPVVGLPVFLDGARGHDLPQIGRAHV